MIRFSNNDNKLIQILKNLPSGYWDFKTENTKSFTHGLHNYPAMMVCPISRNIIRLLKEIYFVESLFDPFAGSGTVLVEGMLGALRNVSGNDLNPLALFLTLVKTTPIKSNVLNKEKESLFNRIEKDFFFAHKAYKKHRFPYYSYPRIGYFRKKGLG